MNHSRSGQALRRIALLVCCLPILATAACAGEKKAAQPTDPMATPTVDGLFATPDGPRLALRCWGKGTPTIVYDAGTDDSGLAHAGSSPVFAKLARFTRVCSYDRAGTGESEAPAEHKRLLDDVVNDLDAVLDAAKVRPPYLMVGSSGGGFDVYHHAGRHPSDVVGLVMLDVPAGQANIPRSAVPAWDSPENPEHVDYAAVERQMALHRLPIPSIPVTVVSATHGQSSDLDEQRVWLEGSSDPVQVTLDSGHDVLDENPDGVAAAITKTLATVRER